jgi:hypothetical protein
VLLLTSLARVNLFESAKARLYTQGDAKATTANAPAAQGREPIMVSES